MTSKIALITGGSRGLGRSAAFQLAEKGAAVVLTYLRRSAEADTVVEEIKSNGGQAVALQLDSSDPSQFSAFEERLKLVLRNEFDRDSIDYLVNNAGFGIVKSMAEITVEDFDALMNVHFRGVFFLTQRLPLRNSNGKQGPLFRIGLIWGPFWHRFGSFWNNFGLISYHLCAILISFRTRSA